MPVRCPARAPRSPATGDLGAPDRAVTSRGRAGVTREGHEAVCPAAGEIVLQTGNGDRTDRDGAAVCPPALPGAGEDSDGIWGHLEHNVTSSVSSGDR